MPEKLKNMFFTKVSIESFADAILGYFSEFQKDKFLNLIYDETWENLELKQKMRHTTICLHAMLPNSYKENLEILKKAAGHIKGFEAMALPDYVEVYGQENIELSLPALKHFTQYYSSEFAIRPFLDKAPDKTIQFMLECADDERENVRRFSSEGCRPRLPWAMALPKFKKDPTLIFKVLEKLKDDESEFVRKSVANNLNDISKDNPAVMLDVCERWFGNSERTNWIVKHACRTQLKAGNKRAMLLFGFGDPENLAIENLVFSNPNPNIGDDLFFSFELNVDEQAEKKVRLEYAVHYIKSNRKPSPKIFQISEKVYKPGKHSLKRKQTFKNMSIRKHYPGEHKFVIIVNGEEKASGSVDLS
jgi:3-methyladenine DNA glycosylase AlkC